MKDHSRVGSGSDYHFGLSVSGLSNYPDLQQFLSIIKEKESLVAVILSGL